MDPGASSSSDDDDDNADGAALSDDGAGTSSTHSCGSVDGSWEVVGAGGHVRVRSPWHTFEDGAGWGHEYRGDGTLVVGGHPLSPVGDAAVVGDGHGGATPTGGGRHHGRRGRHKSDSRVFSDDEGCVVVVLLLCVLQRVCCSACVGLFVAPPCIVFVASVCVSLDDTLPCARTCCWKPRVSHTHALFSLPHSLPLSPSGTLACAGA